MHSLELGATPIRRPPSRSRSGVNRFLLSFALAAIAVGAAVEFIAWRLGETVPPSRMAAEQQVNRNLVVLPPDLKYFGAFKMRRLALERPDVVMIGSSRCNELRSAMMRPYHFYNACLSAWTFEQMYRALDVATKMSHPKIVLFTMDYNMFSRGEEGYASRNFDMTEGWRYHQAGLRGVLSAMIDHTQQTLEDMGVLLIGRRYDPTDHMELLGAAANRAEAGFRYDGSFLYPRGELLTSEQTNRSPTYDMQPGGHHVERAYLDDLARMKALADSRHVLLVGIQLPILATAVSYLDHDRPEYSGVWQEFESDAVRREIKAIGVPFFDLARDPLTADSRNFIDPSHPNEAGVLASLLRLWGNPEFRKIFPELDVQALRSSLEKAVKNDNYTDIYRAEF